MGDADELERQRLWRHAYLGRYMGITIGDAERMPGRLLRAYVDAVSSIVRAENGPAAATKSPLL